MNDELKMKVYSFTLDCINPYDLAKFYARLLKWEIFFYDEQWAVIGPKGVTQGAYPGITFQRNLNYKPPVWPESLASQQTMAHLDFAVNNLEEAVAYAFHCGAIKADKQFSEDWTVMIDPAGHPFCLCQMRSVFEQ